MWSIQGWWVYDSWIESDGDEGVVRYLVLAVLLQVLTDGDGLLDEAVQVLWERWGET